MNNPWAQPPLPIDWEVHPTYPRRAVPYYLAPLWDVKVAAKVEEEKRKRAMANKVDKEKEPKTDTIPRELRGKLKKAKAAKGLLQDLEEQVRQFVKTWEDKAKAEKGQEPEMDSEDEEIVFVGRNGQMNDMPPSPNSKKNKAPGVPKDHLVFDSPADDRGASFGYILRCQRLDSADWSTGAGWSTTSPPTTACAHGLLLSAIPRDEKPTWVYKRRSQPGTCPLYPEICPVPCGV